MSDLRKIGALWRKTSKTGSTFYSGTLDAAAVKSALAGDETRLLIFPVKQKKSEKSPDVELFCTPDTRGERPPLPSARVDDIDDVGF